MIQVKQLSKAIEGKPVLENISFNLETGSIVGLLGRNGAGKTTLLRTLVGILKADEGTISYNGEALWDNPEAKKQIVYVPDSSTFFSQYRVKELLKLYGSIYPDFQEQMCKELLERHQLPMGHVRQYSKGMKALLAIILAFCTKAPYVILDEPTNGLDPIVKRQVLQFIVEAVSEGETTVLISTHHLDEVEKIADTILILKDATIDEVISLDAIRQNISKIQVAFEAFNPENLENVTVLNQVGKVQTLLVRGDVTATLEALRREQPLFLEELPMSLEDVFITTLGGDDHVA